MKYVCIRILQTLLYAGITSILVIAIGRSAGARVRCPLDGGVLYSECPVIRRSTVATIKCQKNTMQCQKIREKHVAVAHTLLMSRQSLFMRLLKCLADQTRLMYMYSGARETYIDLP